MKKQLFVLGNGLKRFGSIKTVEEENIHITLKFLGETNQEQIVSALDGIGFEKFDLSLKGIGVFPKTNYIRVVWVGCDKGSKGVVTLHNMVEERLDGIKKDRDFHPHATLARVKFPKDKEGLRGFVEKNKSREFGGFKVKSFDLMESKLSPKGPEYKVIKAFKL